MMTLRIVMISVLCFLGSSSYCVSGLNGCGDFWSGNRLWGYGGSYDFYNDILEVGILRSDYGKDCTGLPFETTFLNLGLETTLNKPRYLGFNVSMEHAVFFFAGKVAAIYCTDFKQSDLIIRPQIGVSFLGFVNFFWGYGYRVNNNNPSFINGAGKYRAISVNFLLDNQKVKPKERSNVY